MNLRACVLVVTSGWLVAGALPADDQVKKVRDMIQGKWTAISIEVNGQTISDDNLKSWQLTITGDNYSMIIGESTEEGTFKIDATKKPMAIDAFPNKGAAAGQKRMGIFEFDGDKA